MTKKTSKTINAIILAAAALTGLSAQAQDFFPLETGNRWTYRGAQRWFNETYTIEVGESKVVDNKTYFEVKGYIPGTTALIRRGDDGSLFVRQESGADVLLTRFSTGAPYETPIDPTCRIVATPQQERTRVQIGGKGKEYSAFTIRYQTQNCADTGFEEELYAENIGLVRRTVTSFAGPKTYELVDSRVGSTSVETRPGASFQLMLNQREYQLPNPTLQGTLSLRNNGTAPLKLQFSSGQRFDLQLKDSTGRTIATWSMDKLFIAALGEEEVKDQLTYDFEFPIAGGSLLPGDYTLEGWLTTTGETRSFSARTIVTLRGITTQ